MKRGESEARRWLVAAREDLAYAEHALGGGYFAPACFFAQQAAEKAVKAVHYRAGARSVVGHNVRALIQRLDPPSDELTRHLDSARQLDLFYIPARYPNGLDEGTPGEAFSESQAREAIGAGRAIVEAAASMVESV